MTDKELRKLKKPELLEILFYLQKEVEALKAENDKLSQRLDNAAKIGLTDDDINRITAAFKTTMGDTLKVKVVRNADKPKEQGEDGT
ncbi:MAG: hypothetical protein IJO29_03320 [Oscillospiraceae bacterium]|nr:hypothetical protein [Oscillospiraceae bacterium]